MAQLTQYKWLVAVISIAFCVSSFGTGANDVSNRSLSPSSFLHLLTPPSYATSVASRTLTMPQAGLLAALTEFAGATALGSRVTQTIKSGIVDVSRFAPAPATLMLAMTCAELGSAAWLAAATRLGFPVSTTQTCVGAVVGAGLASGARVRWGWARGSVSQIVVSWVAAPAGAAVVGAALFASMKFSILERPEPFKKGLRAIPMYLAFTAAVLALFLVLEVPQVGALERLGAGGVVAVVVAAFCVALSVSYAFFMPYIHRRLVKMDARVKAYHIVLGPLLVLENITPFLFYPGNPNDELVGNYYDDMLPARYKRL
jgi:sodium-dependent phosphate transporter